MNKGMKDDLSHDNQSSSGSRICAQGLQNMIHLLRRRVQEYGEKTVYTYLKDGESQETRLTYCELERRALAIAAYLQSHLSPGERVLLLYPPGTEFPTAFFGCLCAGMVAVPTYPPHSNQFLASLVATVSDAGPTVALSTTSMLEEYRRQIDQTPGRWPSNGYQPTPLTTTWQMPGKNLPLVPIPSLSSNTHPVPQEVPRA